MVDIGGIGGNPQAAAYAAQASEDIKKKQKEAVQQNPLQEKSLKLEQMPKAADNQVAVENMTETEDVAPSETAENILTDMDKQLENVQKGLKDFIAKKIRLAAHNPARSKELLKSAYNDAKKAYDKIKKVRDQLG